MTFNQKRHDAFKAWNDSKCSDEQLYACIADLEQAIDVMRAAGASGVSLLGFIMMLESMRSARYHREYPKKAKRLNFETTSPSQEAARG